MITEKARAWSNGFVVPLAMAAGRLGFTPNRLTVFGCLLHAGVGAVLAAGHLTLGAACLAAASAFDGLDGTLARATGRTSDSGAFLDSVLDRVSEILTFGGLLLFCVNAGLRTEATLAFAAITGSLMVSYTRARSEGIGRGTKVGVFGRLERMAVLIVGLALELLAPTLALLAAGAWFTAGHRIWDVISHRDAPPA